jgi:hypothetical protein
MHATRGARLGVIAQDAKRRAIHHDHRRDPRITGDRSRALGARNRLGSYVRRPHRGRQ